jgi:hypothetical protein
VREFQKNKTNDDKPGADDILLHLFERRDCCFILLLRIIFKQLMDKEEEEFH